MPTNNPYWEIKNATTDSADLFIYSMINQYGENYGYTSAKDISKAIKALGNLKRLNVYINSPGGSVWEGMAIKAMLERLTCSKNVYIDGLCASIATAIAFGCGATVHMSKSALVMIHNAWTYSSGNAKELMKQAEDLSKIDKNLVSLYLDRTNGSLTEEEIITMMDDETWLDADDCLSYGFIDEIVAGTASQACLPQELYDRYKNVPKNVTIADEKPAPEPPANGKPQAEPREMNAEEKAFIEAADRVLTDYNNYTSKRKDGYYANTNN